MNATRPGIALVVSAPSGAGKSTIIAKVREQDDKLDFSVSCTTRAPREGEIDGVHYHFLSRDEFDRRVANGEFLEHAEFSGNRYGTLKSEVVERLKQGEDVIIEIEVQGARQIRESATEGLLRDSVFFLFITPPSMDELEKRLRERGTENEDSIRKRLSAAAREMAEQDKYDAVIVNDDLDVAVRNFIDVLNAKRQALQEAQRKEPASEGQT